MTAQINTPAELIILFCLLLGYFLARFLIELQEEG